MGPGATRSELRRVCSEPNRDETSLFRHVEVSDVQVDSDGSGTIDFDEFQRWYAELMGIDTGRNRALSSMKGLRNAAKRIKKAGFYWTQHLRDDFSMSVRTSWTMG